MDKAVSETLVLKTFMILLQKIHKKDSLFSIEFVEDSPNCITLYRTPCIVRNGTYIMTVEIAPA